MTNTIATPATQLDLGLRLERPAPRFARRARSAAVRELAARYADDPALRISGAGAGVVSNAELLVALAGVSHEKAVGLLRDGWGGLVGKSVAELRALGGITERQARTLASALEVGKRLIVEPLAERPQIRSPSDVAALLMAEMGHLDQEELRTVLLDTKNRVQEIQTIYRGSVNSAQVRVCEVFKEAIRRNSTAIILCHNHPSSDPTPSPEDILVTRQIVEAGKLMDVEILDHLVISRGRFVSMRERGLGFAL